MRIKKNNILAERKRSNHYGMVFQNTKGTGDISKNSIKKNMSYFLEHTVCFI